MFASRGASDSFAARPAGEGLAEFLSSIVIQRFRHDGEMPKSFATYASDASELR